MTRILCRLILPAALVGLFIACDNAPIRSLDRADLFTLDIGRSENELDLFQIDGAPMSHRTEIFMRDGVIFVSNGPANKVMEFTSYGDLISLVYNPEENPEPVLLQAHSAEGTIANRRAYPYSFSQVGQIGVTSDQTLLVEDRLPKERTIQDTELGVSLNRLVLRFGADGELMDYLGQEGIGGTPFPFIEDIHVTSRDEIVVVSRSEDTWLVFWYGKDGEPLYNVEIPRARLPVPAGEDVIPVLEKIVPDKELPRLYLKLNYYTQSVDEQTGAAYGIDVLESRVYHLELESGKYQDFMTVPENAESTRNTGTLSDEPVERLYQLIGTGPGHHLYLVSRESDHRFQLLIMNAKGKVLRRRYLELDDRNVVYQDLHVSPEGILTALLGFQDHVKFVWWRTDRLIGEGRT